MLKIVHFCMYAPYLIFLSRKTTISEVCQNQVHLQLFADRISILIENVIIRNRDLQPEIFQGKLTCGCAGVL